MNNKVVTGAWNVLSLNRSGSLRNLKDELKYKIGIAALQEIRWKGVGSMDTGNFTFFCSDSRNNTLGGGILFIRNYKHSVTGFELFNEQISVLRVTTQFFNISFICVCANRGC
jgi:hypothetical protein